MGTPWRNYLGFGWRGGRGLHSYPKVLRDDTLGGGWGGAEVALPPRELFPVTGLGTSHFNLGLLFSAVTRWLESPPWWTIFQGRREVQDPESHGTLDEAGPVRSTSNHPKFLPRLRWPILDRTGTANRSRKMGSPGRSGLGPGCVRFHGVSQGPSPERVHPISAIAVSSHPIDPGEERDEFHALVLLHFVKNGGEFPEVLPALSVEPVPSVIP